MSLTDEQIKEALQSDAAKEAIKAAVDEEVKGLKAKRDELLGSLKKEKEAKSEFEERLEALEKEKEEAEQKALEKSGDIDKVKANLEERHKKEIEKLTSERDNVQSQLNKHVINGGLTQALIKANVNPDMMDAATAVITQGFKGEVGNNDGTPFAKFDGKAVDEFVTDWANSDSGKRFVLADNNSGGGSNGANGNGKAGADGRKQMSRTEFEALSPAEKSKASIEGVALTD